jgi:hypothetical protein
VDWLEGVRQVAVAVLAVALVFVVNRRATPLIVVGALSASLRLRLPMDWLWTGPGGPGSCPS